MKRHLFYVLMDRTSPIHECEKCLNTNAKSVFKPYSVRSEGRTSRPPVLQEIINTFGSSVPEAFVAFGTFFVLMCCPRGIAAAFDVNRLPYCNLHYKAPEIQRFPVLLFTSKRDACSHVSRLLSYFLVRPRCQLFPAFPP